MINGNERPMNFALRSARGIFKMTMHRQLKIRSLFSGMAIMASAVACSSGGGDGGGGGFQGKLSAEQEAAFQTWLASPVKSCQAIEIMGGGATTSGDPFSAPRGRDAIEKGIDLGVLQTKTKGSLWIGDKTGNGPFAVLSGGARGFTQGTQTSKFEQTIEINGSAQSVKVETESSGFDCVVKVNGTERARVQLAKDVEVSLAGSSSEFSSGSRITSGAFSARDFLKFGGRAARFNANFVGDAIAKSLKSEVSREASIKALGFTAEQIKTHFVFAPSARPQQLAIEFTDGGVSKLNLAARSEFVLIDQMVGEIPEDGRARDLKFVLILATEKARVGVREFSSGLSTAMTITRQLRLENKGAEFSFSDSGLGSVKEIPAGLNIAEQCAMDRAKSSNTLYFFERASRAVAPISLRANIYGPCSAFYNDVIDEAEKSGGLLQVMNTLYRGISTAEVRSAGFTFDDWTDSVSHYIAQALLPGSSLRLAEPNGTPVFTILDTIVNDVRAEAGGSLSALSTDYRLILADMAIYLTESQFAAVANQASGGFIRGVARTVLRVGTGFEASIGGLIRLAKQDWRKASMQISWADSALTHSYLALVREVQAEALKIGYRPYLDEVHGRLFEAQPTESELTSLNERFRGFRVQIDRYPQLKSVAGVLSSALLKSRVPAADYARTIEAAAKLANGDAELVTTFMNTLKLGDGVTEFESARAWALALTAMDQQAIASVIREGSAMGYESEARQKLREAVTARVSGASLQALAQAGSLAKSFLRDEVARASGSTRDTFFESKSKEIAKRIFLEGFTSSDVQSLETYAKIAGSDLMCEGRRTISLRLDCVGLQRFSKQGDGLLSDRFGGRYAQLATRMSVWFGQLMPATDHLTIRRNLKSALFPTFNQALWAGCDAQGYQLKFQALDKAVGMYLVAIGDFITRSRAEREVQVALDARCP